MIRPASDIRKEDELARKHAQTVFDRHMVLEAGAGTGKTAVLVARIVSWCMGPGWQLHHRSKHPAAVAKKTIERVVAITFTERAATEMAERVTSAFQAIHSGKSVIGLPQDFLQDLSAAEIRVRSAAFLTSLDRLNISTIHAFCRRLLNRYALEAQLHPHFEIDADGIQTDALIHEVVNQALLEDYHQPGDADCFLLAKENIGPDQIAKALAILIEKNAPPEALNDQVYGADSFSRLIDELHAPIQRVASFLTDHPLQDKRAKSSAAAMTFLQQLAASWKNCGDLAELRERMEEFPRDRIRKWIHGDFVQAEANAFGDLSSEVTNALQELLAAAKMLREIQPQIMPAAARVLQRYLQRCLQRMRSRGILSFQMILSETADLLQRNPSVCRSIRHRYDQLLVDEFQDTDRVQCAILEHLVLRGKRHPILFVVGDPKQSIYGWRGADLSAYEDFVQALLPHGGTVQRLSVNFRSTPAILEEVERICEPVMQRQKGLQPEFQQLIADRPSGSIPLREATEVEHWVSWDRPTSEDESRKTGPKTPRNRAQLIEAHAMAQELLKLRAQAGIHWGQCAVLMRTTTHQEAYLNALREAGIPYFVERDRSFYRHREILDATALLRAILDPNDMLAVLTYLRSVISGLPDAALLPLWAQGFPNKIIQLHNANSEALEELYGCIRSAAQQVDTDLPGVSQVAQWPKTTCNAVLQLATLRESFRKDSVDQFHCKLRRLLFFEEFEAARYQGEYRLANLESFFQLVYDCLTDPSRGAQELLRMLRAGLENRLEKEVATPGNDQIDAVRVMTIHKSKGLDFEYVYLVDLAGGTRRNNSGTGTDCYPHAEGHELRLFGSPTLGMYRAEWQRQQRERAEAVRTLYVATTRAKNRLVMAGTWPQKASPTLQSHMDFMQLRSGPRPELEREWERLEDRKSHQVRIQEVSWKWPALPANQEGQESESRQKAPISYQQVESDMQTLKTLQKAAQNRQSQPLLSAASLSSHQTMSEFLQQQDNFGESVPTSYPSVPMAIGSAIHRALENLDLNQSTVSATAIQRELMPSYLKPLVARKDHSSALMATQELWGQFEESGILRRMLALKDCIIGREVPLLLLDSNLEGPDHAFNGTMDLIYEDPRTGHWVVVDYKTDAVRTAAEIDSRVAVYSEQGNIYRRALAAATEHPVADYFELWFLAADEIRKVATK